MVHDKHDHSYPNNKICVQVMKLQARSDHIRNATTPLSLTLLLSLSRWPT